MGGKSFQATYMAILRTKVAKATAVIAAINIITPQDRQTLNPKP